MLMMPLLGAGSEQDGLVNDLGMDTAYSSTQSSTLAELTLTVKTDGTWEFTVGAGDALGGSPASGTWLASGSASDYEVKFTPVSSADITVNNATTFTAVTANRAIKIEKNNADTNTDVTIELRRIVNPPRTLSETTNMAANGAL